MAYSMDRPAEDPAHVLTKNDEFSLEGTKQFFVDVKEESKLDTLIDLYETAPISQAVIFCNTSEKVDWLTDKMHEAKFTVSSMHRGMPQNQQDSSMQDFQQGNLRVLISTDTRILGRGVDVQNLSIVINYDVPNDAELGNYIHRLNSFNPRSRSGRKGVAINFATSDEVPVLHDIEHKCSTKIEALPSNVADLL